MDGYAVIITALAEYVSQKVTISFKAKNIKDETTADVSYGLFIINSDGYAPLDLTSSKPKQDEWIDLEKYCNVKHQRQNSYRIIL